MKELEFPPTDSILTLAIDKFLQSKLPTLDADCRRAIALMGSLQVSLMETVSERRKKNRGASCEHHELMRKLLLELATPNTVSAGDQTLLTAGFFYNLGALGAGKNPV